MKHIVYFLFFVSYITIAQVGINTTAPTKHLDINGELRVRDLPVANSSLNLITSDSQGNMGKITDAKLLKNIYYQEATSVRTQYVSTTGPYTKNDVNLFLSNTITIPANTKAIVIVNYSTPIGAIGGATTKVNGYMGVRFLKNGVEAPAGSRKFTVPDVYRDPIGAGTYECYNMLTIGATYTETIDNSANSSSLNVTYSLNGYIEQGYSTLPVTYFFNMWSTSGDNFNWGRGSINTQLYLFQ
ncbi:MAG: hypothetical protein R2781_03650 [Flavobacteriaceae bacterium]